MKNIFKFKPKIKKGHSFDEYVSKHSSDYVNCKLEEVNDQKKLKPNHTYWEINKKYYQINHKKTFKIIGITLGCLGIAASVALPVTYHFLLKERYVSYNFKYWNDCESLNKLKNFVQDSVTPSNHNYIPKKDRIATFDMDGTLFGERAPIYIEWVMFNDYFDNKQTKYTREQTFDYTYYDKDKQESVTEKASYGELYDYIEKFKKDREIPSEASKTLEMMEAYGGAKVFSNITIEQYLEYVDGYLENNASGFNSAKYKDLFYKPMIEVVEFLQINNFDVYVVSGTDRFMVRDIVNKHLNISSNKVIGMDVNLVYKDGKVYRGDQLKYKNVEDVKVELITQEIGKKPVLSFGNSGGDSPMHNYCLSNTNYRSMAFMVDNDDKEREYYNHRDWSGKGYQVFSMKNDFKTIYGDNVTKKPE